MTTGVASACPNCGAPLRFGGAHSLAAICAYCKSIRDDSNYWHRVEEYVTEHSDAQFSHGICPRCLPKVENDMAAEGL